MKKVKDAETQRFIFEIDALIEARPDLNRSKIAQSIGRSPQDFTDIYGGKKRLQRYFLDLVAEKFPIDKNYILTGERKSQDPATNSKVSQEEPQPYRAQSQWDEDLRYTISVQKECISNQRARIDYLEAENFKLMETISRLEGRGS